MRIAVARVASALAVGFLVVLLASLTAAERERVTALEQAVREGLRPALEVVARASDAVKGTVVTLVSLPEIRREQEKLKGEAARARDLERRLAVLEEENRRLRALLGFRPPVPGRVLGAEVVGRNPDNWLSRVVIDQGTRAGIDRNAAVMTAQGLVGRVSSPGLYQSVVTLLSDPGSAVGTMVGRTRDAGVCYGQVGTELLRMRFFSRDARVEPGDQVVTSGLGGVFPPYLVVGTVVETFRGDYGLVQYATVRPAADLRRLGEVLVLLSWAGLPVPVAPGPGGATPPSGPGATP
ncbi:MAG: rod shape-determining protein MreC [Bacillota bacterium]|nr:rod shape-determining protein MreC [Bacillota bacterium]